MDNSMEQLNKIDFYWVMVYFANLECKNNILDEYYVWRKIEVFSVYKHNKRIECYTTITL